MIDLRINGKSVDLPPNFKVTVEYYNPIFNRNQVKGEKSYPINLPADSPINKRTFGHPENLQSASSLQRSYPAELYAHGHLVLKGLFKLRKPSNTTYPGYLVGAAGGFGEVIEGKKLNELEMGSLSLPVTTQTTIIHYVEAWERHDEIPYLEEDDVTDEVTTFAFFWYYNATQFRSTFVKYSQSIESTLRNLAGYINTTDGMPRAMATGKTLSIFWNQPLPGPEPQLHVVTSYRNSLGLQQAEYTEDFTQLSIDTFGDSLNGTVTNGVAQAIVFPMVYNPGFYPEENTNYCKYVNFYRNSQYFANEANINRTKYTMVPMVFFKYVLDKIAEITGYLLEGELLEDPQLQKLIFYNTYSLDQQPAGYNGEPFNVYARDINYKNHLPELTIGECLNELRKFFGVDYFFDRTSPKVELVYLRDIIRSLCREDWTPYAVPSWTRDQEDPKGFTFSSQLDAGDELTKPDPVSKELHPQFQPYITGDGKEKSESKISSLITDTQAPYSLPVTNQKGISPLFKQQNNKFSPRLLFWHGLQSDTNGAPYPKASNVSLDGNFSLQWKGANGLYETFHKDWQEFLANTRLVEMPLNLDIRRIQTLDFKEKKHIAGQNYLIEKLTVEFPITRTVKATLWQC